MLRGQSTEKAVGQSGPEADLQEAWESVQGTQAEWGGDLLASKRPVVEAGPSVAGADSTFFPEVLSTNNRS